MHTPHTVPSGRDDGFSLVELLVVIVIIGILAAIAIPLMVGQRHKADDAQVKSDLRNLATAEESYLSDNPTGYTTSIAALTLEGFKLSANASNPSAIVSGATSYCLSETAGSGNTWYLTSSGSSSVTQTACS